MANFIEQLTDRARNKEKEARLKQALHTERKLDARLKKMVQEHWHLLPERANGTKQPGYAVDGSSRRADLVNGSVLFVAQSLLLGEGVKQERAELEILPGTVEAKTMDRFADLMRQSLEVGVATEFATTDIPEHSVLYLDGALYGTLPQLYPLEAEDIPVDYAKVLRRDYRQLFKACEARKVRLVSIAKTNRQPLFSRILQARLGIASEKKDEISDSALLGGLTENKPGFSTPVLLGDYSFTDQSKKIVLEDGGVGNFPAIISFYVRFAAYDDALRIDIPANCVGRDELIGDLEYELLEREPEIVHDIIRVLMSDYGGLQVYNALAYVSDLEVRLTKQKMYDIYVPLVASVLGEELRIDRSQRRFVE